MPITWRNVDANFNASNTLAMAATRQLQNSFSSLGDRFIKQGEHNQEKNTGEALAQLSGLNNLDSFAADRAKLIDSLQGTNVDFAALTKAGDARRGLLQDNTRFDQANTMFGLNRDAKQFEVDNQVADHALDQERQEATLRNQLLSGNLSQQKMDQSAIDFFNTNDPTQIAERNAAARALTIFETDEKIRQDAASGKNNKGGTTELNNAFKAYTESPAWGGLGEVGARKIIADMQTEFADYDQPTNSEIAEILRRNTKPPTATNSDADGDPEGIKRDFIELLQKKGKSAP